MLIFSLDRTTFSSPLFLHGLFAPAHSQSLFQSSQKLKHRLIKSKTYGWWWWMMLLLLCQDYKTFIFLQITSICFLVHRVKKANWLKSGIARGTRATHECRNILNCGVEHFRNSSFNQQNSQINAPSERGKNTYTKV